MVSAPDLPDDDGIPFSPEERAAFTSTGELDAHLRPDEKRLVELHFKSFVHKNRNTFERYLQRSEPYLPYVRQAFTSRGIPEEMAYLAYVESGFNPNAVSRAGAGGIWQFMPATGKKYGLRRNHWIDERRDPFKATHAAVEHLRHLYETFNDWHLAIAAYNAGEGKIRRALAGVEAKTFFDICRDNAKLDGKNRLKDETMQYVPRFLAVTKIMRNLKTLGFTPPDPAGGFLVAEISVPGGADLRSLAASTGMGWEKFAVLNLGYRRKASPSGLQTTAYVPLEQKTQALAWLQQREARIYAGWKEYTVRRGDTLAALGKRQGASVALLQQVNNLDSSPLKPGAVILTPASPAIARATAAALPAESSGASRSMPPKSGFSGIHQVHAGDTLYALANLWGVSVDAVRRLNNLSAADPLRIGQILYIPGTARMLARTAPLPAAAQPAMLTVKAGDTLYAIARANNMSVNQLCALNSMEPDEVLSIGRRLRLAP